MADSKISDLSAVTAVALTDLLYIINSSTDKKISPNALLGLLPIVPGGRLTLTSGTPVTTADVTGATTVYYAPHVHDGILLWDGSQWVLVRFAEKSLALGTITSGKPYDVFGYLSSGDLAMEMLAWTDDTTRATAVTYQDGRLCKSGDKTRLLLGTFYTTSTTQTEDSQANRYLSNLYNARQRTVFVSDSTDSWTYNVASWRQARGSAANQVNLVQTMAHDPVSVLVRVAFSAGSQQLGVGVGIDSTTVNSALTYGVHIAGASYGNVIADYRGMLAAGKHSLAWLEYVSGTSAITFYGDQGNPTGVRSGMAGSIWN